MEDSKEKKFFEGVLSKTRGGRIRWQPTAEGSEYIAAIGGQFTLSVLQDDRYPRSAFSVSQYVDPYPTYALVLKDQEGRVLTRTATGYAGINEAEIRELYETARRQALRIDDKIDQVLGELSKL